MIEVYLKYDNMHIFGIINTFICTNNRVISCINSMLSPLGTHACAHEKMREREREGEWGEKRERGKEERGRKLSPPHLPMHARVQESVGVRHDGEKKVEERKRGGDNFLPLTSTRKDERERVQGERGEDIISSSSLFTNLHGQESDRERREKKRKANAKGRRGR